MNPKEIGFYARVVLSFAYLSDALLVAFVNNIIVMMTGNPNYLTPTPALAVVSAALDVFGKAMQAAMTRDKLLIRVRNESRNALLVLLRQLAAYVTCHCNGSVLILQGSGFEAVKVPGPIGVLLAPFGLSLSYTGNSGKLQFGFRKVANAPNYSMQKRAASPDGPGNDEGVTSKVTNLLDGLTPGQD